MRFTLKFGLPILATVSLTSQAADLAILRNGNSIRHERRETVGPVTRLYLSNLSNGYIDIPNDQIDHFEIDDDPAPFFPKPSNEQSARKPEQSSHDNSSPVLLNQPAPAKFDRQGLNAMVNAAGQRHHAGEVRHYT